MDPIVNQSSKNSDQSRDDWCTPQVILERVRQLDDEAGIGLDPCASPTGLVKAATEWYGPGEYPDTPEWRSVRSQRAPACYQDGLLPGWAGYGLVFANPPYGQVKDWSQKAAKEGRRMHWEDQLVLLVAARTDTAWWANVIAFAKAVAFWRGRVKFEGGKHTATFPSALIYYGDHRDLFCDTFSDVAWCVRL